MLAVVVVVVPGRRRAFICLVGSARSRFNVSLRGGTSESPVGGRVLRCTPGGQVTVTVAMAVAMAMAMAVAILAVAVAVGRWRWQLELQC